MINRSDILGALARAYCTEANKRKAIDTELLEAMADEVMLAIEVGLQQQHDAPGLGKQVTKDAQT